MFEQIEYDVYSYSIAEVIELIDWEYVFALSDTFEPVTE